MKREVIYLLVRENDAKTTRVVVKGYARYVEAVAASASWHNKNGQHRVIHRLSLPQKAEV